MTTRPVVVHTDGLAIGYGSRVVVSDIDDDMIFILRNTFYFNDI